MSFNLAIYDGNAVSISTTEISLVSGTSTLQSKTDVGQFTLFLDATNVAAGDEFVLKLYEKVRSGGTQRSYELGRLTTSTGLAVFVLPPLGYGWDLTLTKVSGTDRTFTWTIRAIQ